MVVKTLSSSSQKQSPIRHHLECACILVAAGHQWDWVRLGSSTGGFAFGAVPSVAVALVVKREMLLDDVVVE